MRSAVAAFVTFVAGAAHAAQPSAEALIARGLELRRAAKPAEALEMFRRAHALAPSPRTLGQMGLVETSLEHWLDADAHLAAALAAPGDVWVRKNRAFLDRASTVSRAHVGELVITGPRGTDVAVDGRNVATLPADAPVRLVEGTAVVSANSAGFKAFSKTIRIAGGAQVSLAIVLDPVEQRTALAIAAPVPLPPASRVVAPPAALAPVDDGAERSWRTPAGVGLAAVGAGLIAWGITWILVDRTDSCAAGGPACNAVYDTRTAGWILTAGGAAAAGIGAVLLSLAHHAGEPVALDVSATSVSLRGRF